MYPYCGDVLIWTFSLVLLFDIVPDFSVLFWGFFSLKKFCTKVKCCFEIASKSRVVLNSKRQDKDTPPALVQFTAHAAYVFCYDLKQCPQMGDQTVVSYFQLWFSVKPRTWKMHEQNHFWAAAITHSPLVQWHKHYLLQDGLPVHSREEHCLLAFLYRETFTIFLVLFEIRTCIDQSENKQTSKLLIIRDSIKSEKEIQ